MNQQPLEGPPRMRQPAAWRVALAAAAGVPLVLLCIFVVPGWLHPPLSPEALQGVVSADRRVELRQAQEQLQEDARATLLQGIAGALLVAGAIATWRGVHVSREGQITERFSRAVDHLGSDNPDVRLGGIYTLERIAKDSEADRRTVQSVLGAFVRNHAPWPVGAPDGPEHPTATVDEHMQRLEFRKPDVQAAIWVLGRRLPYPDPLQLYLARTDLRGAFLDRARLSGANIRHTNLARAVMRGADLTGSDLHDADLRQAWMDRSQLTGADLSHAYLQGATLIGAVLENAKLTGADLRGANLHDARLEGADLNDVNWDATTVWPVGFEPKQPAGQAGEPAD
jgi:Pentapeptide repeats (8 copies)